MMRVLWFSNTPANSSRYLGGDAGATGGWLESLDAELSRRLELHVAFYDQRAVSAFRFGETTYHPMKVGGRILNLIRRKIFNRVISEEDKDLYLGLIEDVAPDVVHIHGTENAFGAILSTTDVPVVVSIQGNISVCFHKFCSGIEGRFLSTRNWGRLSAKELVLGDNFRREFCAFRKMALRERKNLRNCEFVIGRTAWDRRISRVFAPGRKYFHNDEMLRDEFYGPRWVPRSGSRPVLHSTIGNAYYKGFETLCLALTELNELGCSVDWRVAGISEDDLIVRVVKRMLKGRFPVRGLRLLGKLDAGQLITRMLEADMFVTTSHIENSPNHLCEAMILGMPCVATFAGGTGSLLTDQREGILIQDGDPWSLAGAILEMHVDAKKASEYGQAARLRAQARHDRMTIVRELIGIYETVASKGEARRQESVVDE